MFSLGFIAEHSQRGSLHVLKVILKKLVVFSFFPRLSEMNCFTVLEYFFFFSTYITFRSITLLTSSWAPNYTKVVFRLPYLHLHKCRLSQRDMACHWAASSIAFC
jgi:hypothetical protein